MSEMTELQRQVLCAVCDTAMPRIERDDDPHGFWARSASDLGVPEAAEEVFGLLPPEQREGMGQLLDGLAQLGFLGASQRSREQLLRNLALLGPEAAAGANALIGAALFLSYGIADPQTGQNPLWRAFGYPGPRSAPPDRPRPLQPLVPAGDLALEADAVIVGSGAGGGVVAGTLAQQGLKVVVLEAGGYHDDADFNQLEVWAYQNCYWRGGPNPTADLNVTLQAGFGLGGGTVINWMNCLRTKPWVREQWAREHGLEGVDGPEFDRHLDAVLERVSANDACSDFNGPHQRLKEGADALGWNFRTIIRNTDPATYDPETAGYVGFGDQSGSKRSTAKTFLQDAADNGAEIVTRCWVDRVLVEGGRAAGVEGTFADPATGATAAVMVRAPIVVVACGALESPALLLRSGIGGPAAGQNLRLHPSTAVIGTYADNQKAWWGAPQAGLVDEFDDVEEGYGFLVECVQYAPAIGASAMPFTSAEEHRQAMLDFPYGATFVGLIRDRGAGQVTIDAQGQAVPWYSLTDELDIRNVRRALEAQARIHEAAGAHQIVSLAASAPTWRRGEDFDAFLDRVRRVPLRAGHQRMFAAHQMGTCRMGADPTTSVANPWGELHDTPGVWIGDASAFPTASGTNPMISIMALAHRTAEAIAGTRATTTVAEPAAATT